MKIKYSKYPVYKGKKKEVCELSTLTANTLKRTSYDLRGEAETAREIAEQNSDFLGRLLDNLVSNGVIPLRDVDKLLRNYEVSKLEACE